MARSVRNISYFCIVKRFKRHLTIAVLAIFMFLAHGNNAHANDLNATVEPDSIEISLLTCGPRPNVYSLYGHTAIRYRNITRGEDLAINYGMFSFGKPFFVLRFVFGLTDYEMGIEYFDDFVSQYAPTGCGVRQQRLNLTAHEKAVIAAAIDENYRPENRVYRYNYFFENCTTRARDMIVNHIDGNVEYKGQVDPSLSFRKLIHQYNTTHRWARFGNDLLLGVQADSETNRGDQQFLPENLCHDFADAEIVANDGSRRKLVSSESWVVERTRGVGADSFPLSPMVCMSLIALVVVAVTCVERVKKANYWALDALLMVLTGICGLILLAMVFSQHPTVRLNLQILLLNPINLVALVPVVRALRNGRVHTWLKLWTACIVLFAIGGLLQTYAEGMLVLALSLLIRNISKIFTFNKTR